MKMQRNEHLFASHRGTATQQRW